MTERRIKVQKDGPYLVKGGIPLSKQVIGCDEAGQSVEWVDAGTIPTRDTYTLCRCGASKSKPFCDGAHAKIGFDGTETADRRAYTARMQVIEGPLVDVCDVKDLCAEARYCVPHGGIWNRVQRAETPEEAAGVEEQANLCPSGRYTARRKDGTLVEPELPESIALVEDPQEGVSGPLWVRGGIEVVSADGEAYEVRNRVTLCRCGASKNKPFCDGSHCQVGFSDAE